MRRDLWKGSSDEPRGLAGLGHGRLGEGVRALKCYVRGHLAGCTKLDAAYFRGIQISALQGVGSGCHVGNRVGHAVEKESGVELCLIGQGKRDARRYPTHFLRAEGCVGGGGYGANAEGAVKFVQCGEADAGVKIASPSEAVGGLPARAEARGGVDVGTLGRALLFEHRAACSDGFEQLATELVHLIESRAGLKRPRLRGLPSVQEEKAGLTLASARRPFAERDAIFKKEVFVRGP